MPRLPRVCVKLTSRRKLQLGVLLFCLLTAYCINRLLTDNEYRPCVGNATFVTNRTTTAGVPMILHFVYKDSYILEAYRSGVESCISLNSNWTAMLWTDKDVKNFIHREFPQYKSLFYGFHHKIQRSDVIRYLILYLFGGVYLDLDMTCRQPLMTSLSHVGCFLDKEREHQTQVIHGRRFSAMNSAMGCTPGHPFFLKLIETVFKFAVKGNKEPFNFPETILQSTGPGMLTRAYEVWTKVNGKPPVTLLTESYFSPRINPRSSVFSTCRNSIKGIKKKKSGLTLQETACLKVDKMGYERSDQVYITNKTVAIHQFTHLGYYDQSSKVFNVFNHFPGVVTYLNLCWNDTAATLY